MEGSVYIDLFETKGIEYLLVLTFLPLLMMFWKFLTRPATAAAKGASAARKPAVAPWFLLPEGLFYHQGHSWAAREAGNVVRVGIDDFAQKLLGKAAALQVPRLGASVAQGESAWKLSVNDRDIPLLSPVDGKVVAINPQVVADPSLINRDPYGNGWVMKVEVPKVENSLKRLLSGNVAGAWMEENVDSLRRMMSGEAGLVMQDGGFPVSGIAMNLSNEQWDEIAKDFLLTR